MAHNIVVDRVTSRKGEVFQTKGHGLDLDTVLGFDAWVPSREDLTNEYPEEIVKVRIKTRDGNKGNWILVNYTIFVFSLFYLLYIFYCKISR